MSITVGTDTYVTIIQADAYITAHYISTNKQRVAWVALSDTDKEVYLRNATIAIDNVYYSGILADTDQALSFPRCFKDKTTFLNWQQYDPYDYHGKYYYCQTEVPQDVKDAQTLEALELASPGDDTAEYDTINSNVKSYNITGLSENFATNNPSSISGIQDVIRSKGAQRLLVKYSGGGYCVT